MASKPNSIFQNGNFLTQTTLYTERYILATLYTEKKIT